MTIEITLSDAVILTDPTADYATNPEEVLKILTPFRDRAQEHLVAITMDVRTKVIAVHTITIGTVSSSLVHPREVFRTAILDNASGLIVAHNHPSGDCTPSRADLSATQALVKAGTLIGITVHDHIIVSKTDYRSLRETDPILFRE